MLVQIFQLLLFSVTKKGKTALEISVTQQVLFIIFSRLTLTSVSWFLNLRLWSALFRLGSPRLLVSAVIEIELAAYCSL